MMSHKDESGHGHLAPPKHWRPRSTQPITPCSKHFRSPLKRHLTVWGPAGHLERLRCEWGRQETQDRVGLREPAGSCSTVSTRISCSPRRKILFMKHPPTALSTSSLRTHELARTHGKSLQTCTDLPLQSSCQLGAPCRPDSGRGWAGSHPAEVRSPSQSWLPARGSKQPSGPCAYTPRWTER